MVFRNLGNIQIFFNSKHAQIMGHGLSGHVMVMCHLDSARVVV